MATEHEGADSCVIKNSEEEVGLLLSPEFDQALRDLNATVNERGTLEFGALCSFLKSEHPLFDECLRLAVSDPSKPYGRRVLLSTPQLEVMVARWTPGMLCAPHDHGGSFGAVRVLQGRSRHKVWRCNDGDLALAFEEQVSVGGQMSCGRDLIHSMGDDGEDLPLVTLHLYTCSLEHMVVYDLEEGATLVVNGNCGAWVPDVPEMIRSRTEGFLHPQKLR